VNQLFRTGNRIDAETHANIAHIFLYFRVLPGKSGSESAEIKSARPAHGIGSRRRKDVDSI